MPHYISIDWEADNLTGVEASVIDGAARVHRCFQFDFPEGIDPEEEPQRAGAWLSASLKDAHITTDAVLVVLPREAIVVRRLELPNAPDAELPDLVRFQAATKSSTPLDKLALDYVPLPVAADATSRQVLMLTVDGARLKTIRQVLTAAGLNLRGVGVSPIAAAELVTRIEGEHSADPHQATLIVYQDARRVEITILQQRRVVFTHQLQLTGDEDGIRASLVEINRASIALSQSQHDVRINEVCLIHAGNADPALEEALAKRFGGQLHVLDVAQAKGLRTDDPVDRAVLAAFAPSVGMLFSHAAAEVPAVDFLHPRRREETQDRTKLKLGLAAAGLLLLAGLGYGLFHWHLSGLQQQIATLEDRQRELQQAVKAGAPELAAAGNIGGWIDGTRDPLAIMSELQGRGPGTARLYLTEYEQLGGNRDAIARISGKGYSKSRKDVEELQETLEAAGYRVLPRVTTPSRLDPDYPFEFQLDLQVVRTAATSEDAS
jgi:hypothetical protein